MTLSLNKIRKIKNFRKRGFSYKEISKNLKISPSTSHKYSKMIILSKKGRKRLNLRIRNNLIKFKREYCKIKRVKVRHKKLTIEKTRVISHCFWDGHVSKSTIRYTNTSISLINEFKNDMFKVYGVLPDNELLISKNGRQPLYMIDYYSKMIYDDLIKYSPSFSTKSNESSIPNQILFCNDKNILKEFLRVLWEEALS